MASIKQLEMVERNRKAWLLKTYKNINGIDYKLCNKHHIFFPDEDPWLPATLEYFYKNKQTKADGLNTWCKKCASDKASINYQENRERNDLSHKKYQGSPKHKAWSARNYEKFKGRQSEWRKENPEKCRSYTENHRIHDITEAEWMQELEVFNYQCAYCGISEEESKKVQKQRLHRDHADDTGYNDLRNAIPACRSCNSKKHQDGLETWYRQREFFTEERLQLINWWLTEGYKQYIEDKPPYRITRKQNEDKRTYHWELWDVDEQRNMTECLLIRDKKREIIKEIEDSISEDFE